MPTSTPTLDPSTLASQPVRPRRRPTDEGASDAPETPETSRVPQLGDDNLRYGPAKIPAILIKVHEPGNPDSALDLLISEEGRRKIVDGVVHDLKTGWFFAEEAERARPRTELEILQDAAERGERHPYPGLIVSFALDSAPVGEHDVAATRARVLRAHSLTMVDLAVLGPEPPSNLAIDEEEKILKVVSQCRHVSLERENGFDKRLAYAGMWSYREETVIQPRKFKHTDAFPNFVCRTCSGGCNELFRIEAGYSPLRQGPAILNICPQCLSKCLKSINPPPDAFIAAGSILT